MHNMHLPNVRSKKKKKKVKYHITSLHNSHADHVCVTVFREFRRIYLQLYFYVVCVQAFESPKKYQMPCVTYLRWLMTMVVTCFKIE